MPVTAYVIVSCEREPSEIVQSLRKVSGVKAAHALFGTIEAIAVVEAPDLKGIDQIIKAMRAIPGVKATDTHIARDI